MVNLLISGLFNNAVSNNIKLEQTYVEHVCHTFENLWNSIMICNFKDSTLKNRITKTFIRLFNAANKWQYTDDKKLTMPEEVTKYAKEHNINIDDSSETN